MDFDVNAYTALHRYNIHIYWKIDSFFLSALFCAAAASMQNINLVLQFRRIFSHWLSLLCSLYSVCYPWPSRWSFETTESNERTNNQFKNRWQTIEKTNRRIKCIFIKIKCLRIQNNKIYKTFVITTWMNVNSNKNAENPFDVIW